MSPAKGPKVAPRPSIKKSPLRATKSATLKPTSLTATAGKTLRDKLKIVKDLTEKLWKNKQKMANETLDLNKDFKNLYTSGNSGEAEEVVKKTEKKINSKKNVDVVASKDSSSTSKKDNENTQQINKTNSVSGNAVDNKQVKNLQTKKEKNETNLLKKSSLSKDLVKSKQNKIKGSADNKIIEKSNVSKNSGKKVGVKKNTNVENTPNQSDLSKSKDDKDKTQDLVQPDTAKNSKSKKKAVQNLDSKTEADKKNPVKLNEKKNKVENFTKSAKLVQKKATTKDLNEKADKDKTTAAKSKNTGTKANTKNNSKKNTAAKLADNTDKSIKMSDNTSNNDLTKLPENKIDLKIETTKIEKSDDTENSKKSTKKSAAKKSTSQNSDKNTSKSSSLENNEEKEILSTFISSSLDNNEDKQKVNESKKNLVGKAKVSKKISAKKVSDTGNKEATVEFQTQVDKDKEKIKQEIENKNSSDPNEKKDTIKKKYNAKREANGASATISETITSKSKDNESFVEKVITSTAKKNVTKNKINAKDKISKVKVIAEMKSKLAKNKKSEKDHLDSVKINDFAQALKLSVKEKKQKMKQTKKDDKYKDIDGAAKQNADQDKSIEKKNDAKIITDIEKKEDKGESIKIIEKIKEDKNEESPQVDQKLEEQNDKPKDKEITKKIVVKDKKALLKSPKPTGNASSKRSQSKLSKKPTVKRLRQVAKKLKLGPKSKNKSEDESKVNKQVKALKRVVQTKIGLSNTCKLTKIKLKLKSNKNSIKNVRKLQKPALKNIEMKEERNDTKKVSSNNIEDSSKIQDVKKEGNNSQEISETKVEKEEKDIKPKRPVKPEPSKRLKKLWNAPKGRRVASLNALAKVHCLYENECRSAFELGLLKTTKKSTEKQDIINVEETSDNIDKEIEEIDKVCQKAPRTLRTCAMPSIGKHWDMHELSSTSASSCRSNSSISSNSSNESDSDCESVKKPIKIIPKKVAPIKNKDKVVVKVKRKRNRLDVTMDLKDMVVRKRMASLNATAILAASYENERKLTKKGNLMGDVTSTSSSSGSSISSCDGSLDDPIYRVAGGTIKSDKNQVKLEPNQNLEVLDSIKKEEEHEVSLIVNQDTDVTITGVYLNTTTRSTLHRRLHHHRTASSSSVSHLHRSRYHISSSSSCSSNGVLLETGTKDVSSTESSASGSYTPLGALSSMRPPHQHNSINTTTIATGPGSPLLVHHTACSSAFSAPPHGRTSNHSAETRTTNCSSSSPGYYQPAGPLITNSHHVTAANHFHHHHHHQSQQHLLVQQSPGTMQPIEPALQPNPQPLDQPVKKLTEDNQEVVYHRTSAALPPYAQQVLPAHYYPPPPPGGYGDPQAGLCYGPAQYGHAQAVAAAAYYHAARKVYAPPSPPPSGGSLNPPQQNPQNLQVVSQAANLQAVPVATHDAFRRYVAPPYYQAFANSGSPGPSVVEFAPPPSAGAGLPPAPGRFYPPAYGAPTGPPHCYGHHQPSQQRALAYIEPPYQTPCPCPMQTCQSKNALTGPLIGSEPSADKLSSSLSSSSTQLTCMSAVCQTRDKTVDMSSKKLSVSSSSQAVTVSLSTSASVVCDTVSTAVGNASNNILGVKGPVTNHSLCSANAAPNDAAGVLDSMKSTQQQRVMCFKSEAGAENLSSGVQQPPAPPLMFLPLTDAPQVRPQSSPVRDQTTLNNNLLLTNIKVQSDQEVVKPRKPRIGKSMVRNNMLLANNILKSAQEHQHRQEEITNLILNSSSANRHHLKHSIISDINKKGNIIQNEISREDEKEGFEELIKHEIYDDSDIIATDLSIKKCEDVIKKDSDIIVNTDDEKKCSELDDVKVCKNSTNDISNEKFSQKLRKIGDDEEKSNECKNDEKVKQDATKRRKKCMAEEKTGKQSRKSSSLEDKNKCSESVERTKQNDRATLDLTKKCSSENIDMNCATKCSNKTKQECVLTNPKQRRKLSTENKVDVCIQKTTADKEVDKPKISKRKIESCASDETKRKKCENVKKSNKLSGYKKLIKTIPDKNKNKTKIKRLVKNKSDITTSKPITKRLKLLKNLNSDATIEKPKTHKEISVKTLPKTKPTETVDTICNNNNEISENKVKCKATNKSRKGRPSLSKKQDILVAPKRSLSNPRWSNGWSWEGEPFKGTVFLNSDEPLVTRTCYPSMRHIEGDQVKPRDCVLLKSGQRKIDLPFVAKVAALWENPEDGEMMMSLLWYYRAEHTEQGNNYFQNHKDEVFASRHKDTNSVACIEDKCYVLTFNEYCRYRKHLKAMEEGIDPKNTLVPLNFKPSKVQKTSSEDTTKSHQVPINSASRTNMLTLLNTAPELILFCRKVYDFRQKRIMKNPS